MDITKSQKLEITFKIPDAYADADGGRVFNSLLVYPTSKYEDKTPAVFEGATEVTAVVQAITQDVCGMTADDEWITWTFDLASKQYCGTSVWGNSTYLNLLRIQLQYWNSSADANDTHTMWIKSIKGVADDAYVGADDTFAEGFLADDENATDREAVENGFTFPNDMSYVNAGIAYGEAYEKSEGLLVYQEYRNAYNEVTLWAKDKQINLSENPIMKIKVQNLGYIPYLEVGFVNENGLESTKVHIDMPSKMEQAEEFTVMFTSGVISGYEGMMQRMIISANSRGIDNAYIIESIEFCSFEDEPVAGFLFNGVEDTDALQVGENLHYFTREFTVLTEGASFEKTYTMYAMNGYNTLSLTYAMETAGVTAVKVTLSVEKGGVVTDTEYVYEVTTCSQLTEIKKEITASGNVQKMKVEFVGTGTICLKSLKLGFEKGVDLSDKTYVNNYLTAGLQNAWVSGYYDESMSAFKGDMSKGDQFFYRADAGHANVEVCDSTKIYIIYQNRGENTNNPFYLLAFGADSENAGIDYSKKGEYWVETQRGMSENEWAVLELDISAFEYDYITSFRCGVDSSSGFEKGDLYIRAIILG